VTPATHKAGFGVEAGTKVTLPLHTFPKQWFFFSETTSKPDTLINLELFKKYF